MGQVYMKDSVERSIRELFYQVEEKVSNLFDFISLQTDDVHSIDFGGCSELEHYDENAHREEVRNMHDEGFYVQNEQSKLHSNSLERYGW